MTRQDPTVIIHAGVCPTADQMMRGTQMIMTRRIFPPALAIALFTAGTPAFADDSYPNRTIRIVVPLPAGVFPDVITRIIAAKLQARYGHPVVVENRPGAANNLGAEAVAKSPPDGYTLMSAPQGPFVIAQHFFRNLRYDPTAFVPVTVLAKLPYTLIANPKTPYSTLPEFVAYAKAHPDTITYGSAGTGGQPHLIGAMLQSAAGIRMRHVPYNGLAPAMTDVIGGRIDVMFDTVGNSLAHLRDGKVKVLAALSEGRIPQLPDVPTVAETYPGVVTTGWYAIAAPPNTPPEIAAKLSAAISEALKLPDVAERLAGYNAIAVGESPAATAAFLRKESELWRQVIVANGIISD
jgi:tripartite-type tricarboxylate transporter receptor subunit TctC